MADQIPIKAGLRPDGTFVYSAEFSGSDGVDSLRVTYGGAPNYLTNDTVSGNLDVIDSTFKTWNASKLLASLEVRNTLGFNLWPCETTFIMPYDLVVRDTSNGWDAGTNTYTIPTNGYYLINAISKWDTNFCPTGTRHSMYHHIQINDVQTVQGDRWPGYNRDDTTSQYEGSNLLRKVSSLEYLSAGDEIKIDILRKDISNGATGTLCTDLNMQTMPLQLAYPTINHLTIDLVKAA